MNMNDKQWTQVVAGVLYHQNGQFLLSSRPEGKAYAGYWEFAGGKVEPGESEFAALQREFKEELGIDVLAATPWLTKTHCYEHANVRLRFYKIHDWQGKIEALENQDYCWQDCGALTVEPMLPANAPILKGLALPTALQGSVTQGLQGRNALGEWQVLPMTDVTESSTHAFLNRDQLRGLSQRPSHMDWAVAMVENDADLAQALALGLDAAVCLLDDEAALAQAQAWLAEGVAMPIIGLTVPHIKATELLALGLHALVEEA